MRTGGRGEQEKEREEAQESNNGQSLLYSSLYRLTQKEIEKCSKTSKKAKWRRKGFVF